MKLGGGEGVKDSNSHLLEKQFKWNGIIVEPIDYNFKKIKEQRKCIIKKKIIFSRNTNVIFCEYYKKNLSSIKGYHPKSIHLNSTQPYKETKRKTITLNSFLKKIPKIPKIIDYLSIDTEGSEYDILKKFNFLNHDIRIITCEHNYSANRKKIYNLLIKNNFKQIFKNISRHDDWYVKYIYVY